MQKTFLRFAWIISPLSVHPPFPNPTLYNIRIKGMCIQLDWTGMVDWSTGLKYWSGSFTSKPKKPAGFVTAPNGVSSGCSQCSSIPLASKTNLV